MKTRYKITTIISGIFVAMMFVMTSGSTCIFVDGDTPNWLGSDNGCGPWITYEIQNFFGVFWPVIPQAFGLMIDPYITHIELNQGIAIGDSFVFTMDGKDLKRPLGFRLHYQNDDDVLKVTIRDPNGNLTLTSIIYDISEYQKSIQAEFTPEYEGLYKVEVTNIGKSTVSLSGYHGEMLTWKEIDDIQKEHGYFDEPYDPISVALLFAFIGGSVGLAAGYFVFRRKRK